MKALVPFKYLVEVDIDEGKDIPETKRKAISLAIKEFEKEFKKESILDIAHSLAPEELSKVLLRQG